VAGVCCSLVAAVGAKRNPGRRRWPTEIALRLVVILLISERSEAFPTRIRTREFPAPALNLIEPVLETVALSVELPAVDKMRFTGDDLPRVVPGPQTNVTVQ
jgi:hypothetical protein